MTIFLGSWKISPKCASVFHCLPFLPNCCWLKQFGRLKIKSRLDPWNGSWFSPSFKVLRSASIHPLALGCPVGPAAEAHVNLVNSCSPLTRDWEDEVFTGPEASADSKHQFLECVVCRVVARGIVALCPTCNHGGHVKHISEWFAHCVVNRKLCTCPAPDCDCICTYASPNTDAVPLLQPLNQQRHARVKHSRTHRDSI